uniref:Uncharacterized protein n=1 Tax=Anguilla anguilla TaxID=7936 RepID=A0A0E9QC00_ANGAN
MTEQLIKMVRHC